MNIGKLYAWFWYHTEFWIKDKSKRRPYTYIMRDFYHQNPLFVLLFTAWLGYVLKGLFSTSVLLAISFGLLLGHLFWGAGYEENQQENPEYNPDKEKNCGL